MPKGKANNSVSALKKHGMTPEVVRSRSDLATLLRERVHEDNITDWLLFIMMGKTPILVEDETGPNGYRVVDRGGPMPSVERQDAAFRMMLERRDGLPAQRIHLEAEVKAVASQRALGPELLDAIGRLPPETIRAVREALKPKRLAAPIIMIPVTTKDEVMDAEFTETKAENG